MVERPDQFLVYLVLLSPLILAGLLLIPVRAWQFGRWPAGAAWSAMGMTLLGTFPVVLLEWQILHGLIALAGDIWSGLAASLVLLSFVEEALKIAAIGLTGLAFRRSLMTRPALFLAIGAATGIAFAAIENILFLLSINAEAPHLLWRVAILRTFGPGPMHIVCAMVAAWFVAQAFAGGGRRNWLRALMYAGLLHVFFNGAQIIGDALSGTRIPLGSIEHIVGYVIAVLVVFLVGFILVRLAHRIPPPLPRETL